MTFRPEASNPAWRGRIGRSILLIAVVLVRGELAHAEEPDRETPVSALYVRRPGDGPVAACELLAKDAAARHVTQVLVAFDAISFAPPPGRNEFNTEFRYRQDLPEWIDALEGWAKTPGIDIWAATTLMERPVKVGMPEARASLAKEAERAWWDDKTIHAFEPAANWAARFLGQRGWLSASSNESDTASKSRMTLVVAGGLTPERWVPESSLDEGPAFRWRRMLLPVGTYWDEERVGSVFRRAHCPLYVVSPEARFGDSTPFSDLPDFPWQSRPMLPPPTDSFDDADESAPLIGKVDPEEIARLLADADRAMKAQGLPDAVRRLALEEMRTKMMAGSAAGPPSDAHPKATTGHAPRTAASAKRFLSKTPFWYGFLSFAGERMFHTDTPSGYGYWPYARAAAKSGGKYVFYPFARTNFLDVCPYDPTLLAALAPEIVPAENWLHLYAGDEVTQQVLESEAEVLRKTPWADSHGEGRLSKGWAGLRSTNPLVETKGYRLRRKPYDLALSAGDTSTLKVLGTRLAEALPFYERALAGLDDALATRKSSGLAGVRRRVDANLRLARFGFAMSAFHLHALSLYMQEIDRFIPPEKRKNVTTYIITYVPTIRMSDVLDGYEGRVLPPEKEKEFADSLAGLPSEARWFAYQGNYLAIPEEEPWFRAKREFATVVKNLDPRLLRDATRMIAAAVDVMGPYARSPWGALVYYSEADTFIFEPVHGCDSLTSPLGKGDDPATTPTDPTPGPPAPSSPGGATTPGR